MVDLTTAAETRGQGDTLEPRRQSITKQAARQAIGAVRAEARKASDKAEIAVRDGCQGRERSSRDGGQRRERRSGEAPKLHRRPRSAPSDPLGIGSGRRGLIGWRSAGRLSPLFRERQRRAVEALARPVTAR